MRWADSISTYLRSRREVRPSSEAQMARHLPGAFVDGARILRADVLGRHRGFSAGIAVALAGAVAIGQVLLLGHGRSLREAILTEPLLASPLPGLAFLPPRVDVRALSWV